MKDDLSSIFIRIAQSLERLSPAQQTLPHFESASAFVWTGDVHGFKAVRHVNRVPRRLLKGIDRQSDQLFENTIRFAKGFAANNALLWGAKGMGKSSLVKAVHGEIVENGQDLGDRLKLIEIHREDIATLPACLTHLANSPFRFIVYCDDLSFDHADTSYKALKGVLEGGLEGRPDNVVFYATSNRRHLLPREIMETEKARAINPSDAVDENVSLSDRFGLWIGFHACSQDDYLTIVRSYIRHFSLSIDEQQAEAEALEWAMTRGARSGRVAWQFVQDLAGRLEQPLSW